MDLKFIVALQNDARMESDKAAKSSTANEQKSTNDGWWKYDDGWIWNESRLSYGWWPNDVSAAIHAAADVFTTNDDVQYGKSSSGISLIVFELWY